MNENSDERYVLKIEAERDHLAALLNRAEHLLMECQEYLPDEQPATDLYTRIEALLHADDVPADK